MALLKDIEMKNGMILNYHRIIGINNIINGKTYITVGSYVSDKQREKEKEVKHPLNNEVFINYTIFDIDYNDKLTPNEAYDYLKMTNMFLESESDN